MVLYAQSLYQVVPGNKPIDSFIPFADDFSIFTLIISCNTILGGGSEPVCRRTRVYAIPLKGSIDSVRLLFHEAAYLATGMSHDDVTGEGRATAKKICLHRNLSR